MRLTQTALNLKIEPCGKKRHKKMEELTFRSSIHMPEISRLYSLTAAHLKWPILK